MIRAALALLLAATPAQSAEFVFCWQGSNGYRLEGWMEVPDDKLSLPVVRHWDVTGFFIQGYHEDVPLGVWDLSMLTPETSWNLSFFPADMLFGTGGMHDSLEGQAWNAGGRADDCGDPGFGFNSGTNAQDLCVNNVWITDSMISRYTPFPVFDAATTEMKCGGTPLLGLFDQQPEVLTTRLGKNYPG